MANWLEQSRPFSRPSTYHPEDIQEKSSDQLPSVWFHSSEFFNPLLSYGNLLQSLLLSFFASSLTCFWYLPLLLISFDWPFLQHIFRLFHILYIYCSLSYLWLQTFIILCPLRPFLLYHFDGQVTSIVYLSVFSIVFPLFGSCCLFHLLHAQTTSI